MEIIFLLQKRRLQNLMKKFEENPELLVEYDRIINEPNNLGIIEERVAKISEAGVSPLSTTSTSYSK